MITNFTLCKFLQFPEDRGWSSSSWVSGFPQLFLTLFFLSPLLCLFGIFCPFLNMLFLRHHQVSWGAEPCPVAGPLEPARTGHIRHGAGPASPHRGHPPAPQYQRPGTHTLYSTPGKSHYKKVQLIKSFAGFGRGWPAGYTCANMSDSWV